MLITKNPGYSAIAPILLLLLRSLDRVYRCRLLPPLPYLLYATAEHQCVCVCVCASPPFPPPPPSSMQRNATGYFNVMNDDGRVVVGALLVMDPAAPVLEAMPEDKGPMWERPSVFFDKGG